MVVGCLTACIKLKNGSGMITTESGLMYQRIKHGKGKKAAIGNDVSIYETMSYSTGKVLFSLQRPASPLRFTLGANQVITGVEELISDMRKGEIRNAIVPPHLSKRKSYPAGVSADSSLYYQIELVEIFE